MYKTIGVIKDTITKDNYLSNTWTCINTEAYGIGSTYSKLVLSINHLGNQPDPIGDHFWYNNTSHSARAEWKQFQQPGKGHCYEYYP